MKDDFLFSHDFWIWLVTLVSGIMIGYGFTAALELCGP